MIPAPNNFVSVRSLTGQDLKWVKQLATLATTSALAKKPRKLKSSKLNMKITFFLIMKGWFDETFRYYFMRILYSRWRFYNCSQAYFYSPKNT